MPRERRRTKRFIGFKRLPRFRYLVYPGKNEAVYRVHNYATSLYDSRYGFEKKRKSCFRYHITGKSQRYLSSLGHSVFRGLRTRYDSTRVRHPILLFPRKRDNVRNRFEYRTVTRPEVCANGWFRDTRKRHRCSRHRTDASITRRRKRCLFQTFRPGQWRTRGGKGAKGA